LHGFGYQDAIVVNGREFRIHTGSDTDRQNAICEVFEDGRFVLSYTRTYQLRYGGSSSIDEDYVKSVTLDLHRKMMDEIEVLFIVKNKLEKISDPQPHYRLGKLFLNRQFFPEAIQCFKRALVHDPNLIRAQKRLAVAYLQSKKYEEAQKVCNSALEQHPDFPDLHDLLGILYSHSGNYEKAKNAFQTAIKIKPDYLESNFNLGVVLFLSTLGDDDDNIVIPVRIMRTLNQIKEQKFYQEEVWQMRFQELEDVLARGIKNEVFDILLQLQVYFATKEDSIGATMDFFLLKFMYGGRELKQDEMEFYEQRISEEAVKHKGYADYWNELGVVHLIQCRDYFLKALNEFDKAVEINSDYKDAKQNQELLKNNKTGFLILLRAILR
jgi:tetratricopeptide (TPR) repeat protein